jgi:hypothetical protein
MIEHAHVTLKDGTDIQFPLLIGWRHQAKQREESDREFVVRQARSWHELVGHQFQDDEVVAWEIVGRRAK